MQAIWKFPIEIIDLQAIEMPVDANILSTQFQNGVLCIWAEVSTESEKKVKWIEIQGTGTPMPQIKCKRKFIGTVQQGPFVWHIFERVAA